ncbi:MAG TPA: glycosyltransferase family 2 protein [Gammaproteobacteria bacterium]|nr:glycosyltransferase family 2 protein [Gammaproteobacteria bacterium]
MTFLPVIILVCLCGAWVAGLAYLMITIKRLPVLRNQDAPTPAVWPRLSVIVPACNEASTLEAALATLLRQDYPDLELVLVDDRSTDGTGAIIERLARRDPRVRTVRVETLPAGWLGKVHALQQGVERSSGDWLLFTDADIHFAPGALRRSIALVLHQHIDHLALIPQTIQKSFALELAVTTFGLLFLLTTRAASVNQPGSKAFLGIGAFNLVNAARFHRTPGFKWLRLEPGDDVGLGMMMKRAGGTARLALAYEDLSVQWYPSVPEMFKGLEKNLFGPSAQYRWWLLLLQVAMMWMLALAPYTALALGFFKGSTVLALAGISAIGAQSVFAFGFVAPRPKPRISVLLLPFGMLLMSAMMLWSGYRCLRNGGIEWRGTRYSIEELRAGQRVKF